MTPVLKAHRTLGFCREAAHCVPYTNTEFCKGSLVEMCGTQYKPEHVNFIAIYREKRDSCKYNTACFPSDPTTVL